ncbi:MAG: glycine zipper 2TM domain-containing protein [Sphingomonadaceae bacterium]|nr:glycine zipper 2TM domain-containing protein [Sphingomonadaceae bacterium]
MNRLILRSALMCALSTVPILAASPAVFAQSRDDVRDAREELREQRREYRDAVRSGDPYAAAQERRDVERAGREFDRTRDQYQRNQYGRDRYDGDRYDRQANWDRNRYYQQYNGRYAPYTGTYSYRNGRYIPGPGDYVYRDGRYVRVYANQRGYYGPDNRYYSDYYQCRRQNNLAGTAIGAALGGVAGGSIAPNGDKGAGAILGAVIGGVLGNQAQASTNRRYCY